MKKLSKHKINTENREKNNKEYDYLKKKIELRKELSKTIYRQKWFNSYDN